MPTSKKRTIRKAGPKPEVTSKDLAQWLIMGETSIETTEDRVFRVVLDLTQKAHAANDIRQLATVARIDELLDDIALTTVRIHMRSLQKQGRVKQVGTRKATGVQLWAPVLQD